MGLGHEKLDVYRLSIGYVAWVYEKADGLTGNHRSARDQWLRASQSIPLNTEPSRRKSIPIPVPISISKRRSPNKAREATEYRRFTADVGPDDSEQSIQGIIKRPMANATILGVVSRSVLPVVRTRRCD
jgi:hypothetical protein